VQRVRTKLDAVPGLDFVEAGPAHRVVDLLDDVAGAVVVDAIRTRGGRRNPGDIVRVGIGDKAFSQSIESAMSSHGFGLAEAVGIVAAMGSTPEIVFVGIEVSEVTSGKLLSPPVAAAMPRLEALIEAELLALSSRLRDRRAEP